MKIEIGSKYVITKDKYQYVLTENKEGTSKDGNPIITSKNSYYASLQQIASKILFDYPSEAEKLIEIENVFLECARRIEIALKEKAQLDKASELG